MPQHRRYHRTRKSRAVTRHRSHRRMRGAGIFGKFFRKVKGFLKKHKVISRGANSFLLPLLKGTPYESAVKDIGRYSKKKGYGLTTTGNGLRLAGNGHYRRKKHCRCR